MELQKVKLGDVCRFINGRAYSQPELLDCGKYKVLRVGNIFDGNHWYYSDMELEDDKYCNDGDLLYSWACTFGPYIWHGPKTIYHYHIWKVEPNKGLVSKSFLYYFLNYQTKGFMGSTHGSTMIHITKENMENFEVLLPSLLEQKKIASVLSALDDKIALNQQINRNLEELARLIYDYWFVQFDFPDKNGKPYKTSGGKMVYHDQLKREIPAGWEVGNLYAVAEYINGLACQNNRPQKGEKALPVIKIREMSDGITPDTEEVSENIPSKYIVENGDILFSWSATLMVMIWAGGKGGLNQHIFKVAPKDRFPKSFVYQLLSDYVVNFQQIALSRKTTMGHITSDHISLSRVVLPPENVLKQYAEKIDPIIEKNVRNQIEYRKLTALRDKLLPLLMNGQVSVENLA